MRINRKNFVKVAICWYGEKYLKYATWGTGRTEAVKVRNLGVK